MTRWIVGVDEAGRGPLAGPVAVGIVAVREGTKVRNLFPNLKDSKKLSAERREDIYKELVVLAQKGDIKWCVRYSAASTIDRLGVTRAVRQAVHRGVRAVAPDSRHSRVLLDGLLHAPQEYTQKTIVGGDEKEPLIMLASIVAKVRRDRLMSRLALQYPRYSFEVHKGYGTREHYKAIKRYGLSDIHRRLFCKKIQSVA